MRTIVANTVQGYKKVNPLFVPKLLINLGAGHISMKHGFMVRMLVELANSLAHYDRARITQQPLPVRPARIPSATRPDSLPAATQT